MDRRVYALVIPSVIGGIAGAVLLRFTPTEVFDRLVPVLIFFATVVFMAQEWFQRLFNRLSAREHEGPKWMAEAMLFQLVVAVYGGYFGAGIGILMLSALAVMGHTDIHQMNGLKNLLAVYINGVAAIYFIFSGLVSWPHAVVMAVGAIAGGVGGAGIARRLGQDHRPPHGHRHRVRDGGVVDVPFVASGSSGPAKAGPYEGRADASYVGAGFSRPKSRRRRCT